MIKYQQTLTPKLKETFTKEILAPTVNRMEEYVKTIPDRFRDKYRFFFDSNFITTLLFASAEELTPLIDKTYTEFPELADRYWPAYLLKGSRVPKNIEDFKIRTHDEKECIDKIYTEALAFLSNPNFENCSFIKNLKSQLDNSIKYSIKRKNLKKLSQAANGQIDSAEAGYYDFFPNWIHEFGKIFNYPELSRKIGLLLVKEWNIDVCLYCNNEGIQVRGERSEYRPDLDHFYPKSKFPFLAVSLSNLVPAGDFCNQSYKKDDDMIDYAHPYVLGVDNKTVFFIDYPAGEKISENNYSVKVIPQGGKLDKNLDKFEIANLYSKDNEIKQWLCATFETIDWALGFGTIPNQIMNQIVHTAGAPHAVRAKKFKVDSVNQFAGKNVASYL